jgi:hypothetical protein
VPAALAMMLVSMSCNWLYLSGFGKTSGVVVLLSAASVAIDVLKALAPFWLSEAWKAAHIGRGVAALVVLVLCLSISLASAVGFLAETHAASVGSREAVNEHYQDARAHLQDLQLQLTQVAKARAASIVEAAITAGQHDVRWARSAGCTTDTILSSREFCRNQGLLDAELKAAREGVRLRGEIAKAAENLEAIKAEGGGQDSDPRGSMIAWLTGLSAADVNYAIELCLAVLVEFAAAFGLFLALEGGRKPGLAAVARTVGGGLDLEVVRGERRKRPKRAGQGVGSLRRIKFGDKMGDLRN